MDVAGSSYWLTDCFIPVIFWDDLEKSRNCQSDPKIEPGCATVRHRTTNHSAGTFRVLTLLRFAVSRTEQVKINKEIIL